MVGYAAGIVVGAKAFGYGAIRDAVPARAEAAIKAGTLSSIVSLFALAAVLVSVIVAVYWFGAKRNPGVVSAYSLVIVVFLVTGAVAGARVDMANVVAGSWVANTASGIDTNNAWVANTENGIELNSAWVGNRTNRKIASTFESSVEAADERPIYSSDRSETPDEPSKSTGCIGSEGRGLGAKTAIWAKTFVENTKAYVRVVMEERLPADEAGLMMGVLLGDTSTVPAEVKADFKTTGLSHILAVSGLNVTILITACAFLFGLALAGIDTPGRVASGRFIIFGITAGVIVFYMALCGFAPSIVRAGIMGLAALAAPLAGRPANAFSAMAAAAMVLLTIDPATVFDIGFQLSFAATVSIMLFVPHVTRWISATPDTPSGVAKALAVTISAQLGVAPILAANFGSLSIITPAANAAVAPAIAPAQLLGIVIPMLNYISEPLAAVVAYPAHLSLAYTMAGASFFAKWPFASVGIPRPDAASTSTAIVSAILAVIYFAALAALYLYLKTRESRTKLTEVFHGRVLARTFVAVTLVGVMIIGLLAYQSYNGLPPKGLKVTFLDVGQGDSTLIQADDGATILIDGGPAADSAEAKLRAYSVQRIDLLIITHPHADHVNGLPAVVRDHPIEKAIIPPDASKNTQYLRTLEKLAGNGVAQFTAREGQYFKVGRNLSVRILSPDTGATDSVAPGSEAASEDSNNQAVVALIQYKQIKMLFTGDIEIQTEEDMIADGEAQKIDILKVPHHGSKNGADIALLEILKPRFAVISVGANNRYHHPAPSTLALLRQVGASIFRTDKNGSVTIESDGKTITALAQK